jgi:Protein of unknown function (DUF3040)
VEIVMLSQDDRHRLAEIERYLRDEDPGFVARMQATRDTRWRSGVLLCGALWTLVPILGVLASWAAAVTAIPLLACGTGLIIGSRIRRNHSPHPG